MILPALPDGKHTIHFTGGICDIDTGEVLFSVDVTYKLTFSGKDKDDDMDKDDDEDEIDH
ncbi:MAG: hypothetical protein ABF291_00370 [Desulfobacterales bacterium]